MDSASTPAPDPRAHYHIRLSGKRVSTSKPMTRATVDREFAAVRRDIAENPLGRVLSSSTDHLQGYIAGVGAIDARVVPCSRRHRA